MTNYLFLGQAPRFYPSFGNMIACPGDVFELDAVPNDGLWVQADQPENPKPSRMWPIASFSPTVGKAEVPIPATPTDATEPEQAPLVPEVTPEVPEPSDSQPGELIPNA